jgi:hypothetical protein
MATKDGARRSATWSSSWRSSLAVQHTSTAEQELIDQRGRGRTLVDCRVEPDWRTIDFKNWTWAWESVEPIVFDTSSGTLLTTAMYHLLSSCRCTTCPQLALEVLKDQAMLKTTSTVNAEELEIVLGCVLGTAVCRGGGCRKIRACQYLPRGPGIPRLQ